MHVTQQFVDYRKGGTKASAIISFKARLIIITMMLNKYTQCVLVEKPFLDKLISTEIFLVEETNLHNMLSLVFKIILCIKHSNHKNN